MDETLLAYHRPRSGHHLAPHHLEYRRLSAQTHPKFIGEITEVNLKAGPVETTMAVSLSNGKILSIPS